MPCGIFRLSASPRPAGASPQGPMRLLLLLLLRLRLRLRWLIELATLKVVLPVGDGEGPIFAVVTRSVARSTIARMSGTFVLVLWFVDD